MTSRSKSIFSSATVYSDAAKCLNYASKERPSLLLPSQVNAALSLELYFKALYYIYVGEDFKVNGKHSHDFYKLYGSLNSSIKKDLKSHFREICKARNMDDVKLKEKEIGKKIPRDMEKNLKSWSSVFIKVRYIYDYQGKIGHMMFFPELESSLLKLIYEKEPGIDS